MKAWIAILCLVGLGTSCAQTTQAAQAAWFTVTGSADDEQQNTVQVDPVAIESIDGKKTMRVRVSRSTERRNWENQPYRSYESVVVFHCAEQTAEYRSVSYYARPLWQGALTRTTDYSNNPRPMRFLDMSPNPTARIVRAACQ